MPCVAWNETMFNKLVNTKWSLSNITINIINKRVLHHATHKDIKLITTFSYAEL